MNEQAWPADKTERRNVSDLVPYARNSRTHSAEQVDQIAASINEWGWTVPVLIDPQGELIAGHGRILAAQKLGITDVPCMVADGWTDAQKQAYVIADNKLALNAGWDDELLKVELGELKDLDFDLSLTGFDTDELADMFQEPTEGLTDEDAVPEPPEQPVTVEGDVWLLGRHRLMCGDSTSIDAVERLMDGAKADMVFTDPPYGDNHAGMTWANGTVQKKETIRNDSDLSYLSEVCGNAILVSKEKSAKMVFFKWSHYTEVEGLFSGFGKPSSCCVWDRDEIAAATFSFNPSHEFCFFWGSLADKYNKSNIRNVWRCKKEKGSKEMHPTVKPIEIVYDAIDVACPRHGVVLDLFGGSGSTLIACHKSSRECRMMELDPKYCDVIITRWEQFTGETATLEATGQTYDELKTERTDG